MARFKGEVEAGRYTGSSMTFGAVLTEWTADLERVGRAKTTLETYGYTTWGFGRRPVTSR